jgi:hypothetical protein
MYGSQIVPQYVVKPIVKPLGFWDLTQNGQRMKLLITEWSPAYELFSDQFVHGVVDSRIAPAETLAKPSM